jgi:hypothetical protein
MKKELKNVVVELEKALELNSGLMFGLGLEIENSETQNERLEHEYKQLEKTHKKLYEALIISKKLLKGLGK